MQFSLLRVVISDVPILHIIPTPFPSVWHELSDTKENLHMPTINKFLKVFRLFVVDYLKVRKENEGVVLPQVTLIKFIFFFFRLLEILKNKDSLPSNFHETA